MGRILTISESFDFLKPYGLKFADYAMVRDYEKAGEFCKEGEKYVLKIISQDIVHKTEAKGVIVDVTSSNLKKKFNELVGNAKRIGAKIEGVIVQEMIEGKEVIIGGKKDPQFGPVVLFGLGGILVEVIKDFSLRVAPVSKKEAYEMVTEIKGYPILKGVRGEEGVNIRDICSIISKLSEVFYKNPKISEFDLNPVMVNPKEAVIVDARIAMG